MTAPDFQQKLVQQQLVQVTASPNNRQAIIFLHGFSDSSGRAWGIFPQCVGKARPDWDVYMLRYDTTLQPDIAGIWEADPELPAVAGLLVTELRSDPLFRYEKLAIVAHSMGGLIAQRAVLDDPEMRNRLAHLFLFGTPSAGLIKAAFFLWWKRQLHNMALGGEFINNLRKDWAEQIRSPLPFCLHVVAGTKDQFVPSYTSLKPFGPEFHRFVPGNHLEMVKVATPDHAAVRLVTTALPLTCLSQRHPGEPLPPVLEEFGADPLLKRLRELGDSPAHKTVTKLAIELDGAGMREEAIALLHRFLNLDPDVKGTLAGRYKRMWLEDRGNEFADKALDLYIEAFEEVTKGSTPDADQAYYHAINVAFLGLVYSADNPTAQQWAEVALYYCKKAMDAQVGPPPYWLLATIGEANLYLGNYDLALQNYEEALRILGPEEAWQLQSTWYQAACIAVYRRDIVLADSLERLFFQGK